MAHLFASLSSPIFVNDENNEELCENILNKYIVKYMKPSLSLTNTYDKMECDYVYHKVNGININKNI